MSTALIFDRVIEQIETLPIDEQLQLIERLVQNMRHSRRQPSKCKWTDIRGMASYPMLGEDAQSWVTKNRTEEDNARAAQWGMPQ